eukprot:scaffold13555_cov18-Tisochrysis_lutea.AAC.1
MLHKKQELCFSSRCANSFEVAAAPSKAVSVLRSLGCFLDVLMECQSQGGATAARPGPAFQPPSQGAAPCCSSAQPVSLQIIHQQQQQQQQYHPARQDQSASWFGRSWKEQQQYLQQQQHEGGSQPAAGCVLECDDGTEIAEMVVGEELGGQAGQEGGAAEGEKEGEEQSAA